MVEEKKKELVVRKRELTSKDFVRVNLGKNYWRCNAEGIQESEVRQVLVRYVKNVVEMIETGSGLVLSGEAGVGKTGAAAYLLKEVVRQGFSAYFIDHAELRDLQFNDRVFGDGSDGTMVSQRVLKADFIVLDGLDELFLTDKVFGPEHLERLVIRRNNNRLVTVLTTRVPEEIRKKSALFDVIRQTMLPIGLEGKNLRDDEVAALESRILGHREVSS